MVEIEIRAVKDHAAVLAGVFVPFKDVVSSELDLFFGKSLKEAEYNNARNPDAERDCLKHQGFRIYRGKITPTRKIMRHVTARTIGGHDLRMALVEEGQGPACRTCVDGLPQPVEYQDRLIEQCIHDLVVCG